MNFSWRPLYLFVSILHRKIYRPTSENALARAPKLALNSYECEGIPGHGEDGPPSEAQADAEAQASGDLARPNARYAGGNVYDFINAQPTL